MPFRRRMKRAFGLDPNAEPKRPKSDYPDNQYKPGELMPRPKYRAAYNKEHQDNLKSFSFSDAWSGRRKSATSQYSPMGSRLPSWVGSIAGRKSAERSRKSTERSRKSTERRRGLGSRKHSIIPPEETVNEDTEAPDDVGNVGVSRPRTRDGRSRPATATSQKTNAVEPYKSPSNDTNGDILEPYRTITNGTIEKLQNDTPFTEEELNKALSQTTLKAH